MGILQLPFPSPWGLFILSEQGSGITIIRHSALRGGTFIYHDNPDLQGADWLWLIEKPVNTGIYYQYTIVRGEAGLSYATWGGGGFIKEYDFPLYMGHHFYVYRS
jgi:hypothetical protein